jgi:ABC-type transport system involved in cytochrome bd biosynthesis fused ATPase/permease subunit
MVAVVLGVRLAHGGLAFVDALTVLLLAPELYLPLRQLGTQYHSAAEGCAAVGRIFDIVDAPAAVAAPRVVRPVPDVARTTIRFDEVSFAYRDRAGTVLERLDLQLRPGELAALVGPSGAGKSTVAALLLRFVDPTAGRIVIGGANLRELDPEAWRERIAWVPQRPHLFAGTVAENVRLGAAHASDAAVADALAAARAEFVETLPDGVETRIGEGGRQLSAGEGRRIALARAFLRGAPLVILDEPTAHLDPHSAVAVMAAVERLTAGRTTLMIVHDPILARRADRVVELGATRRLAAA